MKTMKLLLYLGILSLSLVSCTGEYAVEDELYRCIEQEFADNSMDLSKELDTLEVLFLEAGLIESPAPEDYRNYYQGNIDEGMVRFLEDPYPSTKYKGVIQLSLHKLETCALRKFDGETYDESKFARISYMIDTTVRSTGQVSSSAIANAHLTILNADDFEHPYYRANVLLSLQSLYFNHYVRHENYLREIPKKIEDIEKTW
jgi:hypothetical protein